MQQRGGRQEEAEDGGYWDLVYLLYPEAAEAAGLGLLHELVSSWPLIERTLAVRTPPHRLLHHQHLGNCLLRSANDLKMCLAISHQIAQ